MSVSTQAAPAGAYHPDLMAAGFHRYRAPRISVSELDAPLTCVMSVNGETFGPAPVVNVSATGIAIESDKAIEVGYALEEVKLCHRDRVVFIAPATVAVQHLADSGNKVIGLRFAGAQFDAHALQREDGWMADIRRRVASLDQQTESLPSPWRAAVADVRRLLDEAERMLQQEPPKTEAFDPAAETALLATAYSIWGPRLHERLSTLHAMSKHLSAEAQQAGSAYAHKLLWSALQTCPIHRRAHDKPLGYAGDYEMMRLTLTSQVEGVNRYARFLHYAAQRYTLSQAVKLRQECMINAIADARKRYKRPRIVSLASGPAVEIATAIERGALTGPVDLVLVDQDEKALDWAHRNLGKILHDRDIDIQPLYLNLSVKQLLLPKAETEPMRRELANADLIYCAGLYDYLPDRVAQRLTTALYRMLAPGGRLYLGNLKESPDSSWMADYVLAWHLLYREEADMLKFAAALKPEPVELDVEVDGSGHSIFLSVRAPA